MKDLGIVQGSKEQAQPLIVGTDTVYVHTDIEKVEQTEENAVDDLYSYHEIQYSKDEYIKIISEKNASLESQIEATQEAVDYLLLNTGA